MERSDGVDVSPHCQRCGSTNTKFCYYNNYSLTQPRYFCKGCRRYWTKGGSLRNVPVGGGCRKSRRGRAVSISRYHHHRSSSDSPLCYTSLDASCVTRNSSLGSLGSLDAPSNIDLAAVYANFVKQDSKHEPEAEEKLQKDDSQTNRMPCSSTLEMGDQIARMDAMPFELPPSPDMERLVFCHSADWFDSQLKGSNEGPSVHILPDKFNHEIHDISQIIDNWNSFDF